MLRISYLELLFLLGLGSVILGQCLPRAVVKYIQMPLSRIHVLQVRRICLGLPDMQDKRQVVQQHS